MEPLPFAQTATLVGDFTTDKTQKQILELTAGRTADLIVSDMLANTTGNKSTDHFRSISLAESVLSFSSTHLSRSGSLVAKILRGEDEKGLVVAAKELFQSVELVKPKASRPESSEVYLLARKKK